MAAFGTLGKKGTTNIDFVVQPAQSPDVNVLDLGIFNHLQTHVDRAKRYADVWNVETLSTQVISTFALMPSAVLTSMFQKKTDILNEIIKVGGDNTFVVPHRK